MSLIWNMFYVLNMTLVVVSVETRGVKKCVNSIVSLVNDLAFI